MSGSSGSPGGGRRPRKQEDGDSPESPHVPSGPLTRKRAASLRTDESSRPPRIEDLSLNTPTTVETPQRPGQEGGRDHICLCTPAPKVPRPRNAFILYRQHHQAQVVAQNPGLPNPDISKIIGERWREEPDERKDEWKRLAEEEKLRHQRQYPEYRYQPRRGGKAAALRGQTPSSATGEDPGRCPKCGGRYIATPTPRAPSTPFLFSTTPTRAGTPSVQKKNSSGDNSSGSTMSSSFANPNPRVIDTDHVRHMSHNGSGHQQDLRMGSRAVTYGSFGQRPSQYYYQHNALQGISEEYEMASPSEVKRRRYDSSVAYGEAPSFQMAQYPYGHSHPQAVPLHIRQPQQYQQPPAQQYTRHPSLSGSGMSSPAYPPSGPGPLPGPSQLGRGNMMAANSMAPPSRSISASVAYLPLRRDGNHSSSAFDESLRLPPLQTPTTGNQAQAAQPLPPPPSSQQMQGVSPTSESAGPGLGMGLGLTTHQQQKQRERDGQAAMIMGIPYTNKLKVLQKISPRLAPNLVVGGGGGGRLEQRGLVIAIEGMVPVLVRQVGIIVEKALAASGECAVKVWSSAEDVTGAGVAAGEDGPRGSVDAASARSGGSQGEAFGTYLKTIMDWHARSDEIVRHIAAVPSRPGPEPMDVVMTSSSSRKNSGSEDARSASVSTTTTTRGNNIHNQPALLPVAVLADGFSLTISDKFAVQVPISDEYAPVDHWQWMATLWRGIVGPDLVVYVRPAEEEEMNRLQAVELKEPGLMMVRVVVPPGALEAGAEVQIGERIERRLAFEVVEWVRSGIFRQRG